MTCPATLAKSQFLSPAGSCRHPELVPRRHSPPPGRARSWSPAPFTFVKERPGAQAQSSCLSTSSRAGSQFPSVAGAWGQGNQPSFVPACVQNKMGATWLEPASACGAGPGAAFQLAPAPQETVGADSSEP